MRFVGIALSASFCVTAMTGVAHAACWKLPDGSIIETQSNSTPPVAKAKKVSCPKVVSSQPSLPKIMPAEKPGVYPSNQQPFVGECTDFVKARVRNYPGGLTSFDDKKNKMTPGASPRVGDIAVIRLTGELARYGHVAVVTAVTNNSITIDEGNNPPGFSRTRKAVGRDLADAEDRLKIVGYIKQ